MSVERQGPRYVIVPEALAMAPDVSDRAVRLWIRLDNYAGEAGTAFPSRDQLAADLGTSPRMIGLALRELVAAGFLSAVKQGRITSYALNDAPEGSA